MFKTLTRLSLLLASSVFAVVPPVAQDKTPLRIPVDFPPGGSADVIARLVDDAIRDDFSPVTVENRPGAGGRIADAPACVLSLSQALSATDQLLPS